MSVLGPVPAEKLGPTLIHEHILNDCTCWWRGCDPSFQSPIRDVPVTPDILWQLRNDPFANRHNCALDDEPLAIAEVSRFHAEGGRTIVDPTCQGIGRNPEALQRIARASGLTIIMGSGYYLESSHPNHLAAMSAEDVAAELMAEATQGVGDTGVRIGLIGEIGVSANFTSEERKSLRGAAVAAVETGLPLMVHLPGWERLAHEVLDLAEAEGHPSDRVILCHMNPSFNDVPYQTSLAERGAFLEYDMMGMEFWYDDQQVQCPSDEQTCGAIVGLLERGFGPQLLLSQDVFLKMMLCSYGGNGYAHVSRFVLPRLARMGVSADQLTQLFVDNPRRALLRRLVP
ncbi:MAG: phosphotriesterase-related protein [Pseudomonadota bacterium]